MTASHSQPFSPGVRLVLAVLTVWAPVAVLVVTRQAWWDRLPDALPTHWSGLSMVPDGFAATSAVWGWTFTVAVLAGIAAVVGACLHRRAPTETAYWLAFAGGAGGISTAVWLVSASATLDVGDPTAAQLGWRLVWVLLGLGWAVVTYAVAGRVQPEPAAPGAVDPVRLRAGERAVWTAALQSWFLQVVLAVAAVAVIVAAFAIEPWVWPLAAGTLLLAALFWRLQVTVDQRGLRVTAGGLFGLPLKRIRLEEITAAGAEHIDPVRWAGWGYRVLPGSTAIITRSGPGLVLDLRSGRRFAVTVPDPATPAALLTALRHHVG